MVGYLQCGSCLHVVPVFHRVQSRPEGSHDYVDTFESLAEDYYPTLVSGFEMHRTYARRDSLFSPSSRTARVRCSGACRGLAETAHPWSLCTVSSLLMELRVSIDVDPNSYM